MMLPWQKRPLALNSPRDLPGLALWLDSKDVSSLRNDAGAQPVTTDGIKLASDKSGNSSTNVLCLNGVAGNYASFTALAAFGTGDFSVSAKIRITSLSASSSIHGGANNSFGLRVQTDGKLVAVKNGVTTLTASASALVNFQEAVISYVRSGTTGTYYIDGVSAGTGTDNQDYTVGQTILGAAGAGGATAPAFANINWARIYSVALTAPQVVADAAGTVQSNCVFNQDFSGNAKLAPSVTATTGGTVTINTSGATGARISGARDLYQGTAANQPILTIAAAGNYLTFDGSNDYLKAAAFALAQPETVYFVGSQVTWTINEAIYDGNAAGQRMNLYQSTTTPGLNLNGGTSGNVQNANLAVATNGIVTAVFNSASSSMRINRGAAVTGDAGTNSAAGFTLGAQAALATFANITAQEVLVYSGAHDKATQERVIAMLARNNRIALT